MSFGLGSMGALREGQMVLLGSHHALDDMGFSGGGGYACGMVY